MTKFSSQMPLSEPDIHSCMIISMDTSFLESLELALSRVSTQM